MQLDKLNNGHARVAFLMSLGIGSNKTIDNDDDTVTHECFAYQSETLFLFCYFYCYVKGCVYGQPGFNSTLTHVHKSTTTTTTTRHASVLQNLQRSVGVVVVVVVVE